MVDEIYDRHYQAGRNELNAALVSAASRFGRAVINAFTVLNRIEYNSPWTTKPKRARCN